MVALKRLSRRRLLSLGMTGAGTLALGGASTLALGQTMGQEQANKRGKERLRCVIMLWLDGGPSQFETFDPKPDHKNGGPTRAINSSLKGAHLAAGMEQTAEQLQHLSVLRALVSKEGDHERASILMKTGRRPEVNLQHPSLGAVCVNELEEAGTEIPRFVSVLGGRRLGGGYLGPAFDPFAVDDPNDPVQDVRAPVSAKRQERRLSLLSALEETYGGARPQLEARSQHQRRTARALRTMRSPQLKAFDVQREPAAVREAYGDTAFGRGCLMARRLVEQGVRCVEVTLGGWDTHVDNFSFCERQVQQLDPALAALIRELRERDLWDSTLLMCGGEFGRTPVVNPAEGRDHWPKGFSMVMGGAGLRGGQILGDTGRDGTEANGAIEVERVYATALVALGIDPSRENITSAGRPVKLAEGEPLEQLLVATR